MELVGLKAVGTAGSVTVRGGPPAPQHDIGYFDGACDPNPGGPMGMGWRLELADGTVQEGHEDVPAGLSNTSNMAEYLAVQTLLCAYLDTGRGGPLRVRGDSRLVVTQLRGEWAVRAPALALHFQRAAALTVAAGATFEWVRRAENARADALSRGPARAPVARAPVAPAPAGSHFYVDDLRDYDPADIGPRARRFGTRWCHLTTDGTPADLTHFAVAALGLNPAWIQKLSHPYLFHFDLTPAMREKALVGGAVAVADDPWHIVMLRARWLAGEGGHDPHHNREAMRRQIADAARGHVTVTPPPAGRGRA